METLTIFDYLNNLFYKKGLEYNKKIAPAYLITLFLSYDKQLLPLVDKVNKLLFTLPDELIYQYFYDKVPKGKRFIKFPKKTSKKENDNPLKMKYNMSKNEYQHYKRVEDYE